MVATNAAGISGLAGETTTVLQTAGYITSEPETAAELSDFSVVYYAPQFEAEARAVAETLGWPPDQVVQEMPPEPPAGNGTEVVVVVLGADAPNLGGAAAGGTTTTVPAGQDTLLAPE